MPVDDCFRWGNIGIEGIAKKGETLNKAKAKPKYELKISHDIKQ